MRASTPVVLNARLPEYVQRTQTEKKTVRKEKPRRQWRFFWSGAHTLNSCHSLDCARGSKSILWFFNDLCEPIEIYIYVRKMRPFTSYHAAKHSKHSKFAITDMREKPADSHNKFANLRSFASVETTILWFNPIMFLLYNNRRGGAQIIY